MGSRIMPIIWKRRPTRAGIIWSAALVDYDRLHLVAALRLIDHRGHPLSHPAENRVAAVEMRLRRMGDEELRAAGIWPGERHAHGPARVFLQIDLVADRVARPTLHVVAR